jgi:hypothetical protein
MDRENETQRSSRKEFHNGRRINKTIRGVKFGAHVTCGLSFTIRIKLLRIGSVVFAPVGVNFPPGIPQGRPFGMRRKNLIAQIHLCVDA